MGFPLLVVLPFIKAIPSPTGRRMFPHRRQTSATRRERGGQVSFSFACSDLSSRAQSKGDRPLRYPPVRVAPTLRMRWLHRPEFRRRGPNPTCGALQNYHTAGPTRTKQERPEFEMAVFHKRVNQNIRLESSITLNCSLSENYGFPSAVGSVLA